MKKLSLFTLDGSGSTNASPTQRFAIPGECASRSTGSESTPTAHLIGILMSAGGRFLECRNCHLSFEFPAGAHYEAIAKQFEAHSCNSPIPLKDNGLPK